MLQRLAGPDPSLQIGMDREVAPLPALLPEDSAVIRDGRCHQLLV